MFIYARLVTHASQRLWLHWPTYVHMRLYQLLCMCVRGWVLKFHQQNKRIRDKTGHCKTSQQSWPLFSEWQMMTIQKQFRGDVGSGRRSKAISPTVLSVGEHNCALNDTHRPTCVNTHTHKNTSSETSDLCICHAVKICQNGSSPILHTIFFIYLVHPFFFTSCH